MLPGGILLLLIVGCIYSFFFTSLSSSNEEQCIYVDNDDNIDSVFIKVKHIAGTNSTAGFRTLMRHSGYADHIRTGRYVIEPGMSTFTAFRNIKNGRQTPLKLTIPEVRTVDLLAEELSKKMMFDSKSLLAILENEDSCKALGYDTTTVICMFIPNTYEVYWNTPLHKFLDKMKDESDAFWSGDRMSKAKSLNLTDTEVMTLASIVDEETANNAEKPMIAGMYYNRLKAGMPLQADPTIKFAKKDFAAKRVYRNWLSINSPYNTYRNIGLPPGPIRVPSVAGIDAVLNMVHHNYMYMCAKEDFSGTHNFAVTYAEHQKNAAKYAAALNARGIE